MNSLMRRLSTRSSTTPRHTRLLVTGQPLRCRDKKIWIGMGRRCAAYQNDAIIIHTKAPQYLGSPCFSHSYLIDFRQTNSLSCPQRLAQNLKIKHPTSKLNKVSLSSSQKHTAFADAVLPDPHPQGLALHAHKNTVFWL